MKNRNGSPEGCFLNIFQNGGRWTVDGRRWTVDGGRWTVDGRRRWRTAGTVEEY
ncbi:MAG: hypothetical protein IPJ82_15820 [Lewinellaceae bacterium]|nr:hypothetical protein [Lewinellaceae bacterium]